MVIFPVREGLLEVSARCDIGGAARKHLMKFCILIFPLLNKDTSLQCLLGNFFDTTGTLHYCDFFHGCLNACCCRIYVGPTPEYLVQ